jgi:vanillate O-demethylase ferredoxin subunit
MSEPVFPVRVLAIRYEAEDVLSLHLQNLDGGDFPAVDPGAHVDVHLSNGQMRSYSLSNGENDDGIYRLTIARDVRSRGGSVFIHDQLRAGETLEISAPRNNFILDEGAPLSVFFAGGIGITPFIPMLRRLNKLGRPWRLYYSVRTRGRAALLRELLTFEKAGAGEVIVNFDEEPGGKMLDLASLIDALARDTHLYCCGPIGMLDAFRAAAKEAGFEDARVHYEYFSSNVVNAKVGGFTVALEKSGREFLIQEGKSILDTIIDAGIDAPFSCQEGICGACETRVVSGVPDHRDMVLSDKEKAAGKTMMICCSGSKTDRLVLDM